MITIGIIAICIIVFLLTVLDKSDDKVTKAIKYGAIYIPYVKDKKEYWRLITANFVHVDLVHVFMNCYAIFYLGSFLEKFLGEVGYVYLVLMSGLCASLLTLAISYYDEKYANRVTLGASGIFFGFMGAIIVMGLVFQGPFLELLKEFAYIIVINLAFTFLDKRISKTGHIGGLIGGSIGMLILIVTGVCVY